MKLPQRLHLCLAVLIIVLGAGHVVRAATPTDAAFTAAMNAVAETPSESEAEFRAMERVIALIGQRKLSRDVPPAAADAALRGDYDSAVRLAPWVAEYQYRHGQKLVKSGRHTAASYAFTLYLKAAPRAKDRVQVSNLIDGLRRQEESPNDTGALSLPTRAGAIFRECPKCPEMAVIPAGNFKMGSPLSEQGRFDSEGPQRLVAVSAFALARYNVTVKEFTEFLAETAYQPEPCNKIMGKSWRSPGHGIVYPPGMADLREQPAVCVNAHDVDAYVAWLNKTVNQGRSSNGPYRLPTEAEWEYAARANTQSVRWWGDTIGINNANCHGCGSVWDNSLIAPTGSFGPNPFGLYDILGNVWQWTADCWNESYTGAPTDGGVWTSGDCTKRVIRGGSWSNLPVFIRSATRSKADVSGQDFDFSSYVGFRLARALPNL